MIITPRICILLTTLLVSVWNLQSKAQQDSTGKLIIEPYKFRTYDGIEHDAEFGKLWVKENRTNGSKRLIQLSFVVLRTTSTTRVPPIVFLAGGPGAPGIGMGQVPIYFSLFDKLRAFGDVILLDQRGLGLSVPNLKCSAENTPANLYKNEQTWLKAFEAMTRSCAQYWKSQGVDISSYTNDASADDIDDVRKALKADKISLLGHSYGTVLATSYVRRHGENLYKLIMAATDAPDQLMVLPSVWDILIKKLSYIAQSDTSISKLIPDFEGLYRKVLNKLEAKPLLLTVINYAKKRNDTIVVGKVGLQWLIRNFMTDARTYYMIPALVYTIDKGDYRVFSKQIEPFYNNFSRSLMATAVDCSVGWSEERRKIAMQETTGALFSTVNMQWISACEWLGNKVKPESRSRIFSTVPVLFISGTLDTSAPPFQAEEMRWGFPNSNHLIVENGSHESLLDKNVQSIMVDFLKGVDVQQRTAKFNLPDFLSPAELILRNSTNK